MWSTLLRTAEHGGMPVAKGKQTHRFKSIRSYRRWLENIMQEAAAGRRDMGDASKAATAVKAAAELFMVEQMLVRHGRDVEFDHPLGEDGGLEVVSGKVSTVVITYDADGNEIRREAEVDVPAEPPEYEEHDPKAVAREIYDMF